MNRPTFSIILPIYNQEHHLPYIFKNYPQALDMLRQDYEIIVVVNGSKDNSYDRALELANNNKFIKVYNLNQGGWGRAVLFGLNKARGRLLGYTNSARTNPDDLALMLKYALINESAVYKASRMVRDNYFRRLGSVLYNFEFRFLFKAPVWDVNGTPKVFPASILKQLELKYKNDLIDAELVAKSFKLKIPIIEIPVRLTNRICGKSTTNIKSIIKMYLGLIRLKKVMNGLH